MRNSSRAVTSFVVLGLCAVVFSMAACSGAQSGAVPSAGPASGAAGGTLRPLASSGKTFILSLTPTSLTFLHATSPAQTITMVLADQRTLTLAVQDPTVASAALNPGSITQVAGGGFQETITVTPLKPGVTNLFINTQQGTVATVPIDIYAELQSSAIVGNVINCKKPSSCTAASTLGGASLNFNEQFYPNSYTLSTDVCQTADGSTTFAVGGTQQLQLTPAGYTALVNAAVAANQKTESLTCTTTVNATESVTTTETFTVTFQSLQKGAGL